MLNYCICWTQTLKFMYYTHLQYNIVIEYDDLFPLYLIQPIYLIVFPVTFTVYVCTLTDNKNFLFSCIVFSTQLHK